MRVEEEIERLTNFENSNLPVIQILIKTISCINQKVDLLDNDESTPTINYLNNMIKET